MSKPAPPTKHLKPPVKKKKAPLGAKSMNKPETLDVIKPLKIQTAKKSPAILATDKGPAKKDMAVKKFSKSKRKSSKGGS